MHIATLVAFHNELEKIATFVHPNAAEAASRLAIIRAIPKRAPQVAQAAKGAATAVGSMGRVGRGRVAPAVAKAGWSKGKKMLAGGAGVVGLGGAGVAEHAHQQHQEQNKLMMQ